MATSSMNLIVRADRVLERPDYAWAIGDVLGLIEELRNAFMRSLFRPAIDLLEAEIARLKTREQDLLETNNRYLQRARDAEAKLKELT